MLSLESFRKLLPFLKIAHRETGALIPFELNNCQRMIMHALYKLRAQNRPLWIIVPKSRRVGVSTFASALGFAQGLAMANARILTVAHLADSSSALFETPQQFVASFPIKLPTPTQKKIFIPHRGGMSIMRFATAGAVESGRALRLSTLHFSEAANIKDPNAFSSLLPALSYHISSIRIIESTPRGKQGPGAEFYERCEKARRGISEEELVFLSWLDDPGCVRDPEEADDAPATDMERELMKDFGATKGQIAWSRWCFETQCNGIENRFFSEYPYCIDGDSLVSSDLGIVKISDASAPGFCDCGRVRSVAFKGDKECVAVGTRDGRTLVCTPDHQIKTIDGFVEASETLGKTVELVAPSFHSGNEYVFEWPSIMGSTILLRVTPELARFLGYFMGDGSYHGPCFSIVCDAKDADVIADVTCLLKRFLGTPETRKPSPGSVEIRVTRTGFKWFGDRMGVLNEKACPSRRVCVPECILRSPKAVVKQFLRGLFEADGTSAKGFTVVMLASKHKKFLQDVQLLLLGFGITSRIQKSTKKSGKLVRAGDGRTFTAKSYDCYYLRLRASESAVFYENIGFVSERKNKKEAKSGMGRNRIPIAFTDVVTSVDPVGTRPVWDMSVEDSHRFGANGIVVHNCYDVAFTSSAYPAFEMDEIKKARKTIREPIARGFFDLEDGKPRFRPSRSGTWLIWENPIEGHEYFLGGDAARGKLSQDSEAIGDFAAVAIFDGSTGRQVARFADRISPDTFSRMIYAAAVVYNNALVNIELTGGWGRWAQKELRDTYFYPNLYGWKGKDDKMVPKGKSNLAGWETTSASRDRMYNAFRAKLRANSITIRDEELLRQMSAAEMFYGRWEVEKMHDDILVAAFLAVVAISDYAPVEVEDKGRDEETETVELSDDIILGSEPQQAILEHWNGIQSVIEGGGEDGTWYQ